MVRRAGTLIAVACLLLLVSSELYWWGEARSLVDTTRQAARFAAQVWISIAWAITGATLLVTGFARRMADLRWAGLAALFLTATKVFLADLAQLDTIYKVGSFLVLGVLLVGGSFLYQRARSIEEAS